MSYTAVLPNGNLLYAGDYDAAIAQGAETFEIDEKYGRGFVFIGSAYLAKGDADQAPDWFQRGQSFDTAVRSYDAMIVRSLAALGRREEAEEILARLEGDSRQQYVRAEYLAMGHAAVGNLDRALHRASLGGRTYHRSQRTGMAPPRGLAQRPGQQHEWLTVPTLLLQQSRPQRDPVSRAR